MSGEETGMNPEKTITSQRRPSRGKQTAHTRSGHRPLDEDKSMPLTTETASQKRPRQQTKKKDHKVASPEVVARKITKRSPKGIGAVKAKRGVTKTENPSGNTNGMQQSELNDIKKEVPRKKREVKKRKVQGENRAEIKRQTVKKEAGKKNISSAKGAASDESRVNDARKKAKTTLKRKRGKAEVTEIQQDISAEPERKQTAVLSTTSTEKRKKQKLSTEKKRKTTQDSSGKKEGVAGKVDGVSEDTMAKQVSTKAAKFVGAHMSVAGGLENAVKGAVATGAKAFALFLRSQRQWAAKPLEDKPAEKFRQACQEHNFSPHVVLPHGSYLLNCGSPNVDTLRKSREALADELNRCEKLGMTRYNFHPGSTCGKITVEECLDKIGESINIAHKQTNNVMTVIENMSRQGNTVGGRFEELHGIIERVKDKSRIGVCLDTCHAFAAGFDLSSESGYQDMMSDFDKIVGLKYLVAVHLNDSKGKVGSHLDRHEKIGKGQIGIKAFKRLMNDPRFDDIPLILETPVDDGMDYAEEIKLLYSLVGES